MPLLLFEDGRQAKGKSRNPFRWREQGRQSSILQKSEEGSPEERMTYFHNFLPTSLLLMRNNLEISKIEEGKEKTLKFATYIHLSIHTGSHGDFSDRLSPKWAT